MATLLASFDHLSDPDLLREVTRLAAHEREATARLIACLAEVDGRRLYLGEGCASLFTYCTSCCVSRSTRRTTVSKLPAPHVGFL